MRQMAHSGLLTSTKFQMMKKLLLAILFTTLIPILFVKAQTTTTDISSIDKQQEWIQLLLSEHDKPLKYNDYLFYCTGHHGIVWSLIASDSSGIYFYNGTTREQRVCADSIFLDSLSFVKENIKTITWGFDSLVSAAKLLKPIENRIYNPFYSQIYVVIDNNLVFSHNDTEDYYTGADSIRFNHNLSKLVYLMFWLSAPSCRPYMPMPGDMSLQ